MSSQVSIHFDRLSREQGARVARIILRNTPLNVIDARMMQELSAVLAEIEAAPEISTIVLQGAGKCFSAGVDVAAHAPGQVASMLQSFHSVVRAIMATPKVTIAAVHGNCLGGGAEMAMMCDIAITAENATWGFPEITLGCYPPVAVTALSALVGHKRASELILTGRAISGSEAARIGLASQAVAENQLQDSVDQVIGRLQNLSPAALAITKKSMYGWDAIHFDKGLARAEKIYLDELMQTQDAQEGIRAFLEKRQPRWTNR
jgi:cyclohexa-1,5-dienecarbonyl-CoA hydratase